MDILTKEQLKALKVGDTGRGIVYLKSFNEVISGKGTKYIRGEVMSKIPYMLIAWNSSQAYGVMSKVGQTLAGCAVEVTFEVIEFASQLALSLNTLTPLENVDIEQFFEQKYNRDAMKRNLLAFNKERLSPKGYNFYLKFMGVDTTEDSLWENFCKEQAAVSHHDNCATGLIAHTYKALVIGSLMVDMYDWLGKKDIDDEKKSQDELDIFFLGINFHDIGKVKEMLNGIYQPNAYSTHRVLGIEMMYPYKDEIISLYGEHGWYMLESIIIGHHDEFGDPAKSLYAYLVHQADMLDCTMTQIGQDLVTSVTESPAGRYLKYNGKKLALD